MLSTVSYVQGCGWGAGEMDTDVVRLYFLCWASSSWTVDLPSTIRAMTSCTLSNVSNGMYGMFSRSQCTLRSLVWLKRGREWAESEEVTKRSAREASAA